MDTLAERLGSIERALSDACTASGRERSSVTLVAVSKRQPNDLFLQAYECGVRDFGENTLQGFEARKQWAEEQGLDAIRWHFIGQIQSRKAKAIWGQAAIIHTFDRLKLLRSLSGDHLKSQEALVQVNIGEEPQKGGVAPAHLRQFVQEARESGARVSGLMCIPHNDSEPQKWFSMLRDLSEELVAEALLPEAPELSMGMSSDFVTAVRYGATLVRVGSSLFGERITQ